MSKEPDPERDGIPLERLDEFVPLELTNTRGAAQEALDQLIARLALSNPQWKLPQFRRALSYAGAATIPGSTEYLRAVERLWAATREIAQRIISLCAMEELTAFGRIDPVTGGLHRINAASWRDGAPDLNLAIKKLIIGPRRARQTLFDLRFVSRQISTVSMPAQVPSARKKGRPHAVGLYEEVKSVLVARNRKPGDVIGAELLDAIRDKGGGWKNGTSRVPADGWGDKTIRRVIKEIEGQ